MTPGASEAALAALSARLGLPLAFDDDSCSVMIGDQPFSIRRDGPGDRLVVSALVADDLPDAPSRKLVEDLLNLGFGLMHDGLPAVARDPETGFIAAFAIFAGDRLVVSEFPSAFEKFAAFAQRLTDRLDAERSGYSADSDGDAREASAVDPAGFDIIHV